ncbi:hypothetical protein VTK56DRAFT_4607 [Thermocarpiscus australiensis]
MRGVVRICMLLICPSHCQIPRWNATSLDDKVRECPRGKRQYERLRPLSQRMFRWHAVRGGQAGSVISGKCLRAPPSEFQDLAWLARLKSGGARRGGTPLLPTDFFVPSRIGRGSSILRSTMSTVDSPLLASSRNHTKRHSEHHEGGPVARYTVQLLGAWATVSAASSVPSANPAAVMVRCDVTGDANSPFVRKSRRGLIASLANPRDCRRCSLWLPLFAATAEPHGLLFVAEDYRFMQLDMCTQHPEGSHQSTLVYGRCGGREGRFATRGSLEVGKIISIPAVTH